MSAIFSKYHLRMPRQKHYYGLNHLHFITASTYRRARLFDSDRFRRCFIATLDHLRVQLEFRIIGYVLMPEHFHLLIWPSEKADPSGIIRSLKERTAKFVLRNLQGHQQTPWRRYMLARLTLPDSVHDHAQVVRPLERLPVIAAGGDALKEFLVTGEGLRLAAQSEQKFNDRAGIPTVSSSGPRNGVLWLL